VTIPFDCKCYELAETFLEDEEALNTEANRNQLASEIQQAIEDFIEAKKSEIAAKD